MLESDLPLFVGRLCIRKPRNAMERAELIQRLEAYEVDDLPVSALQAISDALSIPPEDLTRILFTPDPAQ